MSLVSLFYALKCYYGLSNTIVALFLLFDAFKCLCVKVEYCVGFLMFFRVFFLILLYTRCSCRICHVFSFGCICFRGFYTCFHFRKRFLYLFSLLQKFFIFSSICWYLLFSVIFVFSVFVVVSASKNTKGNVIALFVSGLFCLFWLLLEKYESKCIAPSSICFCSIFH